MFFRERTVQANFYQPNLMTFCQQLLHGFLDGLTDRTHGDDHIGGIRRTHIVKRVIGTFGQLSDLIHVIFHDVRHRIVVFVGGFPALEENIRILCGTPDHRMLRIQGADPEAVCCIPVQQILQIFVVQHLDLLNFV